MAARVELVLRLARPFWPFVGPYGQPAVHAFKNASTSSVLTTSSWLKSPGHRSPSETTDVTLRVVDECVPGWNGDGSVNTQDFIVFLNLWVAGC